MTEGIFHADHGEYRFVYNLTHSKKWLVIYLAFPILTWALFFSVFPGAWDKFYASQFLFSLFLVLFFLPLSLPLLSFYSHWRRRIVVGPKGISCSGFWPNNMPRYSAWNDFARIRFTTVTIKIRDQLRIIVFTHKNGKQYLLPVGAQKEFTYIGDGHAMTLAQAITTYSGPAVELSGEDKERIFSRNGVIDPGKEVGQVAYAALAVAILAVVLMYLPGRLIALDSPLHVPLYWTAGIGAFVAACWNMRRAKNKFAMIPFAMLLVIAVVFMTTQLLGYVSLGLGDKRQEPFRIVIENDTEQIWQSSTDPAISFLIHSLPGNRNFKGVGTERTLTLYRGPLQLNAIPQSEYKSLYGSSR